MSRVTTGPIERTRPSSRLQPQSLTEKTPVLFRLPSIDVSPFRTMEESDASLLPTVAALQLENLNQGLPPATSHVEPLPEAPAWDPSKMTSEPPRSWWEHWSSGVVMILLIIALVTLGIMIFRPSSNPTDATLASENSHEEFGDLESISIPKIQTTETSALIGDQQQANSNRDDSAPSQDAVGPDAPSAAYDLANIDVAPFDHPVPKDLSGLPSSSMPLPSETLPDFPGKAIQSERTNQNQFPSDPLATATLLQPIPNDVPKQFYAAAPTAASSFDGSALSTVPTLPGSPNSRGNNEQSVPSQQSAPSQQVGPSEQLAQSPSFSMPNLAGERANTQPIASQVSSPIRSSPIRSSQEPRSTDASAMSSPGSDSQPATTVRSTATPESDEEQIIRAYMELSRSTQPPPGVDSPAHDASSTNDNANRYQRN